MLVLGRRSGTRGEPLVTSYYDIRPPKLTPAEIPAGEDVREQAAMFTAWRELGWNFTEGARRTPQLVTKRSPIRFRRAVWQMARFFQREGRYDFVGYGYEGKDPDATAHGCLWFDPRGGAERCAVIGAACFRWMEWDDAPAGWLLCWVWLHPYQRGRGHLARAWPFFRVRFAGFEVDPPFSPAMVGFLRRVDPDVLSALEARARRRREVST
jgi:hypothetical protein